MTPAGRIYTIEEQAPSEDVRQRVLRSANRAVRAQWLELEAGQKRCGRNFWNTVCSAITTADRKMISGGLDRERKRAAAGDVSRPTLGAFSLYCCADARESYTAT